MDEDLNYAVDKICKGIRDYIFPTSPPPTILPERPYILNKSRLDRHGSWSSCSRFLPFSEKYKSKFKEFMEWYSRDGIYPTKDVLPDYHPETCPMDDDEDVLNRYKNFKRFDTVEDYSDHLFATSPMQKRFDFSTEWLQKELRTLEEKLPETIFVRVYEGRTDLLRAVIIGAKGTPYHDGLFFFDVLFPPDCPLHAPLVRYHSGGFGINPHLFKCGEFRLSLISTWTMLSHQIWNSSVTPMVQVLVAIQDRVLNADPLFHQPGFLDSGPSVVAEYFSLLYNEDILIKSLKTMMYIMDNPPKNFETFVVGHFRNRALDILKACKDYMDGLQVGCVVSNKDSCCSNEFRNDVTSCFPDLVYHLKKIGATEADNFIPQSAPTPQSLLESSIMYKPELSRLSASTSAAVFEIALNDLAYRVQRAKLSEILQTQLGSPDSSIINEPPRSRKSNGRGNPWKNLSAIMNLLKHKPQRRAARSSSTKVAKNQ